MVFGRAWRGGAEGVRHASACRRVLAMTRGYVESQGLGAAHLIEHKKAQDFFEVGSHQRAQVDVALGALGQVRRLQIKRGVRAPRRSEVRTQLLHLRSSHKRQGCDE